jgi:hypothetical protein
MGLVVPLAGLEPAACCLGDNCPYSAQTVPVGSGQLRLGGHSGECGLVGYSRVWWNDRENDHLSKQRGRSELAHCAGMPQRERIAGVLVGASAIHLLLRLGEGSVRHEAAIGLSSAFRLRAGYSV